MIRPAVAAGLLAALTSTWPAFANDHGRFTVDEENDTFASRDDRHYTQGIAFSYVSGDIAGASGWNTPFDAIGSVLPILEGGTKRKYQVTVGQSLFTPANTATFNPDPKDRPYAGWLYAGVGLLQDLDGKGLENFELLAGIVGDWQADAERLSRHHQGRRCPWLGPPVAGRARPGRQL